MRNSTLKFSKAMAKVSPFRVMTVMDQASAIEAKGEKVVHMEVELKSPSLGSDRRYGIRRTVFATSQTCHHHKPSVIMSGKEIS